MILILLLFLLSQPSVQNTTPKYRLGRECYPDGKGGKFCGSLDTEGGAKSCLSSETHRNRGGWVELTPAPAGYPEVPKNWKPRGPDDLPQGWPCSICGCIGAMGPVR